MKFSLIPVLLLVLFCSCKKILSTPGSSDTLSNEEVFSNEYTANAYALNMYSDPMKAGDILNGLATRYLGLMADELQSPGTLADPDSNWYKCEVAASDKILQSFWSRPYEYIYQGNTILKYTENNGNLRDSVKQRLRGEAYFFRALSYFYLVNIFDGVPSISKTGFAENMVVPRASKDSIYSIIVADLLQAEQLLPEFTPGGDSALHKNTRASKWAAKALLARTFLYMGRYDKAAAYANAVIHSGRYHLETQLNNVFVKDSKEIVLQFQPVMQDLNSLEASYFLPQGNKAPLLIITPQLLNSFEQGDLRKKSWINSITVNSKTYYFPYKYKVRSGSPVKEYNVVMRLGELYLIRAEALAMQGKLYGSESAVSCMEAIRTRAGLGVVPNGLTQTQLLQRIEKERQTELFAEWGHRWLDLKRTTGFLNATTRRAIEVLQPLKPALQPYRLLFPIPARELLRNTSLIQNPLY